MTALSKLGVPYTEEQIKGAQAAVAGSTEAEALISYLQTLGLDRRPVAKTAAASRPGSEAVSSIRSTP